jgi:hypothetical protein
MSVIRVGSTGSYAEGWDFVFGSGKTQQRATKTKGRVAKGKRIRKPPTKAVAVKAAGKSTTKVRKAARKKKATKRA